MSKDKVFYTLTRCPKNGEYYSYLLNRDLDQAIQYWEVSMNKGDRKSAKRLNEYSSYIKEHQKQRAERLFGKTSLFTKILNQIKG